MGSKTLHQQDLPVLNWKCWLYNGRETVAVGVERHLFLAFCTGLSVENLTGDSLRRTKSRVE